MVNAGAGSGKTTTILHKIIHLLENDYCKGDEILILAYNKSVREELIERINKLNNKKIKDKLNILTKKNVHTFHSFGYRQLDKKVSDIFDQASDSNKELEEKKNRIINNIINKLFENKEFKNALCSYFYKYFFTYKDLFEDIKTYEDYVNYVWNVERKTLNGDWVRSFEEVEISNYLYLNGIKFEYEKKYKGKTDFEYFHNEKNIKTQKHLSRKTDFESLHNENDIKAKKHLRRREKYKGEYHPDFYLTDYNIYLEHFALNKNNEAPPFFKDRGKYYEQYLKKKELHKLNKTKLITTYSWQKQKGILTQSLEKKLKDYNVKFKTLKDSEIMEKFKETGNINSFCKLISTFMSHYKSNELEIDDIRKKRFLIPGVTNWNRALIFINLFKKIFDEYQKILKEDDSIDYDDMIIHGRKKIINENFKYILVDEFQDISQSRSKLLQKIKEKNKSKLFCVGDDWQSIYRFNGSDISIFTKDFEKQFGYFERVDIDTTFRFGNKINELSSSFIQKNPDQMKKTVRALDNTPEGSIVIYDFNDISKVAKEIIKKEKKGNIFILGRYNLDMYDKELKRRFFKSDIITKREVKEILKIDKRFNYKTVHKSKGLEAETVIIINMFKGAIGFPSQTEDDELLILVLPNPEAYPYAEERRLFYVALTGAKKNIYIFSAEGFFSSNFIKEVKENHLNLIDLKLKDDGNDKKSKKRICPTHKVKFIFKKGKYGPFYSCPKWKSGNCNYTENA